MSSALLRYLPLVPLLVVSVVFAAIGVLGVLTMPAAWWAAMPGDLAGAAATALICLVLAAPASAYRPSLIWVLPLAGSYAAGAAGWALLPLAAAPWSRTSVGGAVLLLPVMVLVLGAWWRRIPPGLAATAAAAGASPAGVLLHAVVRPALPGVARGLALVFVLALGLAPLLAQPPGSP